MKLPLKQLGSYCILFLSLVSSFNMKRNEQYCSFTHGEVRAGRFDPEVFVNCLQNSISS